MSRNFGEISPIFRLSEEGDTISSTDSRFEEFSGNFRRNRRYFDDFSDFYRFFGDFSAFFFWAKKPQNSAASQF